MQNSKVKITSKKSKLITLLSKFRASVIASASEAISMGLPRLLRSLAMTTQREKINVYRFFLLSLLFIATIGIFSFEVTHALFSDNAQSTDNTFTAAEEFPPPPGITNHVVISEVQITGGSSHTTDDFIELYNPTSSPINLGSSDFRLVKRSGSSTTDTSIIIFSSSHIIPTHGFFLWANSGFSSSINADVSTTDTLASSNSIALKVSTSSAVIDALSWNSAIQSYKEGTEFTPDPGANQSMERKALSTSTAPSMAISGSDEFKGNGFDADNNSTDFILRTISQPQHSTSSAEMP